MKGKTHLKNKLNFPNEMNKSVYKIRDEHLNKLKEDNSLKTNFTVGFIDAFLKSF